MNLKTQLHEITAKDYQIPEGVSIDILISEMMCQIGSTDSELRDSLIYMTLYNWTIRNEIDPDLMRQMLYTCLDDEHLFLGLGEQESDTVFTRAFSVLVVPLALHCNDTTEYLTEQDIRYTLSRVLLYLNHEVDLRGYVKDKGWAHAIAHAADALESIVNSPYISKTDCLNILEAILFKTHVRSYYYVHGEDERMSEVVATILKRNILSNEQLTGWIHKVAGFSRLGDFSEDSIIIGNSRNLLRSVYFKILSRNQEGPILEEIIKALDRF